MTGGERLVYFQAYAEKVFWAKKLDEMAFL